jgi:hypothetical protein
MQVCLELEEIQVTPGSLNCIMNMAIRFTAYWTGEFAGDLKIDVKVQLLFFNFKLD